MSNRNTRIRDNHDRGTVGDFLKANIENGSSLSVVSAYFTIHAFEALKAYLWKIDGLRFLFGEPDFIKNLDSRDTDPKVFKIEDEGLQLNKPLQQRPIAQECADWIEKKVEIKSTRQSNLLHGKMYHIVNNGVEKAVMGSSNFTVQGLGLSQSNNNIELNLEVEDSQDRRDLKAWFDDVWNDDERVEDVKKKVIARLEKLGDDQAPEFIYYKTLYELFRDDLEARMNNEQKLEDTHLYDTKIWDKLYDFQKDGVKSVIARLLRHNGCILADSVGLGKTYTALAVIKFFELRNDRVLVLCPKKLRENWALYPVYYSQRNNPFEDDKFGYSLLSHTDLSRYTGDADGTDLAGFNWSNFDLVVIDESHNFRNDTKPKRDDAGNITHHSRYTRLLEEVIKEGAQTKVLMLSATPVNTSLIDLRNQIYLMTEKREDAFQKSLGISNIRALLGQAQREFKAWEDDKDSGRDKSKLLAKLGADFFQLLGGVSIARSRRHIENFYADEIGRIGEFPEQLKPENHHPLTDLTGALSYKYLADQIEKFSLSVYTPSSYVISKAAIQRLAKEKQDFRFNQLDREKFLIGMMQTNFLKRLESSAHSLTETLERTIGKIDALLEKIARYEQNQQTPQAGAEILLDDDILPEDDEDDEEFLVNRARHPYHLRELDCARWKKDLIKDRETLTEAWKSVKGITPERDGKLRAIREHIRDKAQNPLTDKDGEINRKLLVFTTFKDTAEYLYENLSDLAAELSLKVAMVSGDVTRTQSRPNNFNAILTNFAPRARGRAEEGGDEIDLLIATDCISEGQNLQDCDTVLNYDIHWNPVRIIQRFGRIDRIGSRNKSVRMINYWPTEDMEVYLRLQSRVEARMALADAAATGTDDPLNESAYEQAQMELNFRNQQLKQLREEVLDFDDLSDGVVLSDFTLDYFFTQLLRYLEKNKKELEATPNGVYAVTHDENRPMEKGVIFFLRQRNASTDIQRKTASPLHPFYAVYIRNTGDIRYGCANTRQVLDLFESAAVGKIDSLQDLCIQFDTETKNGENMGLYNGLLKAVIDHISRAHTTTQTNNMGLSGTRDFELPLKSETPRDTGDFELVTWLVITTPQKKN
ncbi:ATP-dependent helicase [Candidatus Poribacteria bacterium]|nr:MAG: ATP-dependent helicase [Candidatus Poribacteria bacterium]